MTLPQEITAAAQQWLAKDPDTATRAQLFQLIEEKDEGALKQAFGDRLAFGTAGLRGVMGIGPNNMNRLLIREATAGLGKYLLEARPACAEQSVVIAYDGRHGSKEFAADAAGVLAALGLSARLYNCRAPTPLGAFAVKKLGTAAGVVVTASHNPPEFNGYKVYQAGGTQINAPVDAQIAAHIAKVAASAQAPACLSLEQAQASGLVKYLDTNMFDTYVQEVVGYLAPGTPSAEVASQRAALKVAYTPMHGVGAPLAEAIFKRAGFTSFWTVAEQREPDGDFPTVKFPNPEEDGAMDLVHALADKHGAHIAIANDPDADRLSVSARTKSGEIKQMSGDHIGTILGDELLRRSQGDKRKTWSLSTIVSSRILARLAEADGSNHRETLTGFKWLGAVAKKLQDQGQTFAFAYEEALGYMVTSLVWDKDGLSALLLLSLLACDLHARGETLWTRLEEIHRRVGLSVTLPRTIRLKPGTSGGSIMKSLRANLPREMAGQQVALIDDLLDRPAVPSGDEIPKNDVVRFYIGASEGLSKRQIELSLPRIIIRPSGTEPKVKIYCESRIEVLKAGESYEGKLDSLRQELTRIADAFEASATGKPPPAFADASEPAQPPILRALNDKATSTLIKQGAEAKVYKATLSPEPPTLTVPTSSTSSSTSIVSTTSLPASPPILLKYRFPKTYRHPHLSQSITTSRTIGEVRAIVRCMKHRVNVPEVVLVDEKVGVLGLEWIDGQSVRELLGGGAEADEVGEEEQEEAESPAASTSSAVADMVLTPEEQLKLMPLIGRQLANMHSADVIHGDLTTSNMMLRAVKRPSAPSSLEASFDSIRLEGESASGAATSTAKDVEAVLIDFGLSFNSTTAEDKAVDLYVLERAFNSTHPNSQHLFAAVLTAYGQRVDELWQLGRWSAGSGEKGGAKNPNKAARAKAQAEAQGKQRAGFAAGVGPWKEIQRRLEDVRMRGRKRSMVG